MIRLGSHTEKSKRKSGENGNLRKGERSHFNLFVSIQLHATHVCKKDLYDATEQRSAISYFEKNGSKWSRSDNEIVTLLSDHHKHQLAGATTMIKSIPTSVSVILIFQLCHASDVWPACLPT